MKDRIEQRARDYFERVRENYLWQAREWPARYRVVDAGKSIGQVGGQISQVLRDFFGVVGDAEKSHKNPQSSKGRA